MASATRFLEIKIPTNFMNTGISVDNIFFADTNDSENWDTLRFPLPWPEDGKKWKIESVDPESGIVIVVQK